MKKKIRAFIACEMPEEIQAAAARLISKLLPLTDSVKWVEPANVHLTLAFLGEVSQNDAFEISRAAASACSQHQPFAIEVAGAGAFPATERPRTLWVGVSQGAEQLELLQVDIAAALADIGYPPERRRFHGHLTLGRVRGRIDGRLPAAIQELSAESLGLASVDEAVLFSSQLSRQGPSYSRQATFPLSAASSGR